MLNMKIQLISTCMDFSQEYRTQNLFFIWEDMLGNGKHFLQPSNK